MSSHPRLSSRADDDKRVNPVCDARSAYTKGDEGSEALFE